MTLVSCIFAVFSLDFLLVNCVYCAFLVCIYYLIVYYMFSAQHFVTLDIKSAV